MKSRLVLGSLLLLSCGCSTMNNTQSDALAGGGIGAVTGAVVGAACRAPLVGAAIGAVAGTAVGAAVGSSEDRHEQNVKNAVNAQAAAAQAAAEDAAARAPKLSDIVSMAKSGASDAVIITAIRNAYPAIYQLNADDIAYLKSNNISDAVVIELQNSARNAPPATAVVYPGYGPPPPPGGVVYVGGVYGGYGWHRGW